MAPPKRLRKRGSGQHLTSQRSITARLRMQQAVELRLAGLKLDTIAEQLGYRSRASVHHAIMDSLAHALREPAEQLREISVQRCDRMLQAIWPQVLQGHLPTIGMALRIEQRRAQLLGLDTPQQIDLTIYVQALARAAGKDEAEALAEVDNILAHSGRHFA